MGKKPKPNAADGPPWTELRRAGSAGIEAYVAAAGKWHPLIEILPSPHYDNRTAADYIVRAMSDYPLLRAVVRQAADALDICLARSGRL